tara:strand:+ start:524 stop:1291 length:768 start_codon:yes stop_codon:yes gene_type:complete
MIISHKHKYVFVGLPLAASTAISKELCQMYDGKPILSKHAIYQDFLKVATKEEKKYKVIACSRNPLDISVSQYTKMMINANGNYSNGSLLRKNGGHIKQSEFELAQYFWKKKGSYDDFLKEFYKVPFDNFFSVTASYCQYVMRFDRLQEDFEKALLICDIEPKRPLPIVNKTEKKGSYEDFFNSSNQKRALQVFGPYMLKHNISFPTVWKQPKVSAWSKFLFSILANVRKFYWLNKSYRDTIPQKVYKELQEKYS